MTRITQHIWCVNDADPRYFAVIGSKDILVVDTGFGKENIKQIISSVSPLPQILLNTHFHGDHTGGDGQFDQVYAHPADFPIISKKTTI